MAFPEHGLNSAIAEILGNMSRTWEIKPELTGQIKEGRGLAIDILIKNQGRSPIAIENEYDPANTVQKDAESRLGKNLINYSDKITSVVELISPNSLKKCNTQAEAQKKILEDIEFRYALLIGETVDNYERFPANPRTYISGTIRDFAEFIGNAGVSKDALESSINILEEGVQKSIMVLKEAIISSSVMKRRFANLLKQDFKDDDIEQILGIAVTVMINALVFQQRLIGAHDIRSIAQMQNDNDMNQSGLLMEWNRVLEINYWSVFSLAKDILCEIRQPDHAQKLVDIISDTACRLSVLGIVDSHDLAGVVFQRFITDRKYLATFYTRPESATLLTHLAISINDWQDVEKYRSFRAADYACGTGTLIHAVYDRITRLHELAGGDPKAEHAHMIGNALTAADIVPSAAHLTASMLSSVYPSAVYEKTRVVIPKYGADKQSDQVWLGSLELLSSQSSLISKLNLEKPVKIGAKGTHDLEGHDIVVDMKPDTQDIVIMNPPYTRAMSDWIEGGENTWKPFNALGNNKETQKMMNDREKKLTKKTCYNGYQSMPSAFCAVANHMCKYGGTIALVLPLTCCQGSSWKKFRNMFLESYHNIIVIGIAADESQNQAWSADTNMAEVLIIANKIMEGKSNIKKQSTRGVFVSLYSRPRNSMESTEAARSIRKAIYNKNLRQIDDGPYGGTPIKIGEDLIGEAISAPLANPVWSAVGIRDLTLAQFATQLNRGNLWYPRARENEKWKLPISPLNNFANIGRAANNIANNKVAAFDKMNITENPTYPMLWKIKSDRQRQMIIETDMEGRVRKGKEILAEKIWKDKSYAHLCADLRFTSQSLSAAWTEEQTIGGAGWPNIQLKSRELEETFMLWANSSLGLIQYWYHASRQQIGRGRMPVTAIATLPYLNVTKLPKKSINIASSIFAEMKNETLMIICKADIDPVRKELDRRILCDVLSLPEEAFLKLDLIRKKWCAEPSVHGGKKTKIISLPEQSMVRLQAAGSRGTSE